MSRVSIISDIHGNLSALEAVLARSKDLKCQQFIFLGDICGYYSEINECIELIKRHAEISILGNHDSYILSNTNCPRSNTANTCLELQRSLISYTSYEWLSTLTKGVLNYKNMSLTHGGWRIDPLDEYMYKIEEEYFEEYSAQIFMSGHTHVQTLVEFDQFVYCNPGSVGQPRDGDPTAAFAILDKTGKLHLERVEYDIGKTCEAMAKHGMPRASYECLYDGVRIDGNISTVEIAVKGRS